MLAKKSSWPILNDVVRLILDSKAAFIPTNHTETTTTVFRTLSRYLRLQQAVSTKQWVRRPKSTHSIHDTFYHVQHTFHPNAMKSFQDLGNFDLPTGVTLGPVRCPSDTCWEQF